MNIFADMHHGALTYSLHLLFEKRLGHSLFRPIGLDWYDDGFWKYSPLIDTMHSYLDVGSNDMIVDNHYEHYDPDFDWTQKALTLEQFKAMDIGAIIASVGTHEMPYSELRNRFKPNAYLIRQIGNWNEDVDFNISKNLMVSTGFFGFPPGVNGICYHQEFDLEKWRYVEPTNFKTIKTFINCFPDTESYDLWPMYKKLLPEFAFKMHGINGDDGMISPQANVVKVMADSGFIWQVKLGGEGFGHVIHGAYALGRPCIVKGTFYVDKIASYLLEDGVTCIDLDKRSVEGNVEAIKEFSQPDNFRKMSLAARARFDEVVNYDREGLMVKEFLNKLVY